MGPMNREGVFFKNMKVCLNVKPLLKSYVILNVVKNL